MAKRPPASIHPALVASRSAKAIGERLAYVRKAKQMSQAKFAKEIGSSQGALGQYEVGMRRPAIEIGLRIRDRFGVSLDFLYAGDISKLPFDLAEQLRDLGYRP
jgi:transcriptional regulator with XRE-family HTH domain